MRIFYVGVAVWAGAVRGKRNAMCIGVNVGGMAWAKTDVTFRILDLPYTIMICLGLEISLKEGVRIA